MTFKVLLINSTFPIDDQQTIGDFKFTNATFQYLPTLHDFHVIVIDVKSLLIDKFWIPSKFIRPDDIRISLQEQIVSGGIVLCFCDKIDSKPLDKIGYHYTNIQSPPQKSTNLMISKVITENSRLYNYFFCPIYLGLIDKSGDTFNYSPENLGYFKPLMRKIPIKEISWNCYFHHTEQYIKSLGTNRAGYPVFIEISLGLGKLVMLPIFENKNDVFSLMFKEILPQMIKEEDLGEMDPKWLTEMQIPSEIELKQKLSQIRSAKKLISTDGKSLEKAMISSLKLLGFNVEKMQIGSHADIRISDGDKCALVEVKGHKNRQANRKEFNQLFAFLAEIDSPLKGIMVVNHEFDKSLKDRSELAFTSDLISLAKKADIALISSVDLFDITLKIIENLISEDELQELRQKILDGSGIIKLSSSPTILERINQNH